MPPTQLKPAWNSTQLNSIPLRARGTHQGDPMPAQFNLRARACRTKPRRQTQLNLAPRVLCQAVPCNSTQLNLALRALCQAVPSPIIDSAQLHLALRAPCQGVPSPTQLNSIWLGVRAVPSRPVTNSTLGSAQALRQVVPSHSTWLRARAVPSRRVTNSTELSSMRAPCQAVPFQLNSTELGS